MFVNIMSSLVFYYRYYLPRSGFQAKLQMKIYFFAPEDVDICCLPGQHTRQKLATRLTGCPCHFLPQGHLQGLSKKKKKIQDSGHNCPIEEDWDHADTGTILTILIPPMDPLSLPTPPPPGGLSGCSSAGLLEGPSGISVALNGLRHTVEKPSAAAKGK